MDEFRDYEPDVVGISCTSPTFLDAIELADAVREAFPQAIFVLGGAHVTAAPREAMQEQAFEVGVIGEGEMTFLELVQEIRDKGSLDKIEREW